MIRCHRICLNQQMNLGCCCSDTDGAPVPQGKKPQGTSMSMSFSNQKTRIVIQAAEISFLGRVASFLEKG